MAWKLIRKLGGALGGLAPKVYARTGFRDKTLWDWLGLLFIPATLAGAVLLFDRLERNADSRLEHQRLENEQALEEQRLSNQQAIAADRFQANAFQSYLDEMTELLLEKGLRRSGDESEVRTIAKTRTLALARQLDADFGRRRGLLLQFLHDSGLITSGSPVLTLDRADLSGASLTSADLSQADLKGSNLSGASMLGANLTDADLSQALLPKARMAGADLIGASLRRANLSEAVLTFAHFAGADLRGIDLSRANLNFADLTGADLRPAPLPQARLTTRASVLRSDLRNANLSSADLTDAHLDRARLDGAIFCRTTMPDGSENNSGC